MAQTPRNISVESYTYDLPENRIAKYPLEKRDESKLLVFKGKQIQEDRFYNLKQYLAPGHLLVFNNTRVIHARLGFRKETGAHIEIFCLEPVDPSDYQLIFQQTKQVKWRCLVGNLKKWKSGILKQTFTIDSQRLEVTAQLTARGKDSHIIEFNWDSDSISFGDILEQAGNIPIPPYLQREAEENDKERYQTVYSREKGSVAAPTAGLHFTDKTFGELSNKGIKTTEVTLHVGAGTFQPVKSDTIGEHPMHTELISVTRNSIQKLIDHIDRIIAVGTTSLRTLESLYWLGRKINHTRSDSSGIYKIDQWEPYEADQEPPVEEALKNLLDFMDRQDMKMINAHTRIIIVPGYRFKMVRGLVTNFHQPRSTLLLLVAAFAGKYWKDIYHYALSNNFRFLSYGDSSLLFRQ